MKKLVIILMFALFATTISAFADDSRFSESYLKATTLIDSGSFLKPAGRMALQDAVSELSPEWKLILMDKNEKSPWLGCGLNLLIPSLGSWVTGDISGALITDGGIIGGAIAYSVGMSMIISSRYYVANGYYSYYAVDQDAATRGLAVAAIGGVIIISFEIASLVMPFMHAAEYNSQLKKGLGLADDYMPASMPLAYSSSLKTDNDFKMNLVHLEF